MQTWIIGAGGLLGSALVRKIDQPFVAGPINWDDQGAALADLAIGLKEFCALVESDPLEPWAIIWAAGRTNTASSHAEAEKELVTYSAFIKELSIRPPSSRGCFTLASSAGGVYAGSDRPPFTSLTDPLPMGIYGKLKLNQEELARELVPSHIDVMIARIANVYGPGQDLRKLQGFISRLAQSAISKEQVNVFVSIDTLRDYIYVDDAACLIVHWIEDCLEKSTSESIDRHRTYTKVIATGEPVSLGYLINLVQDVTRVRIPIAYGSHISASAQTRDLRLFPDEDAFTRNFQHTTLPAGVKTVYSDLLLRHQQAHPIANSLG